MTNILTPKNNASGNLDSGISANALAIDLKSGEGADFPQPISASATSGGSSTSLNSTGIQAAGVSAGDYIENVTDGSWAFVVSVDTNAIVTTPLSGGDDNTWSNSDVWAVGRFAITINKKDSTGALDSYEIAIITERSTDQLTVNSLSDRGAYSTTPTAWDTNDYVELYVVSAYLETVKAILSQNSRDIENTYTQAEILALFNARNWKAQVVCATTAAITLASDLENGDTIDGITLSTGDRVLVKDQADATENGVYTVNASGAPTRATDFDATAEITSAVVPVTEGTAQADSIWICSSDAPTIGVDDIDFSEFKTAEYASDAEAEAKTSTTKSLNPSTGRLGAGTSSIETAGENVDGSSTPQAVMISDGTNGRTSGRYYKADADDITNAANRFDGFVTENTSAASDYEVVSSGMIAGFSGLTIGAVYYLSTTAGGITTTNTGIRIGVAISASEIMIDKLPASATGSDSNAVDDKDEGDGTGSYTIDLDVGINAKSFELHYEIRVINEDPNPDSYSHSRGIIKGALGGDYLREQNATTNSSGADPDTAFSDDPAIAFSLPSLSCNPATTITLTITSIEMIDGGLIRVTYSLAGDASVWNTSLTLRGIIAYSE